MNALVALIFLMILIYIISTFLLVPIFMFLFFVGLIIQLIWNMTVELIGLKILTFHLFSE